MYETLAVCTGNSCTENPRTGVDSIGVQILLEQGRYRRWLVLPLEEWCGEHGRVGSESRYRSSSAHWAGNHGSAAMIY